MSFGGDLHTFDVFDLLGWLMGRKRAGILQMTRRSTKKRLAFRDGQVQWSSSNDPRETIGQALVRDGLIQEEPLFRALLKQETAKDKRRLGEILIGDGLLTEPQLSDRLTRTDLALALPEQVAMARPTGLDSRLQPATCRSRVAMSGSLRRRGIRMRACQHRAEIPACSQRSPLIRGLTGAPRATIYLVTIYRQA